MTERKLTPMQEDFLSHLFGAAKGDFRKAMDLAGYGKGMEIMRLARSLRQEIIELAEINLALNAPKAAMAFGDVLDDPAMIGAKEKTAVAREILDRVGLSKVEKSKLTVDLPNALFILPPKDEVGKPSP